MWTLETISKSRFPIIAISGRWKRSWRAVRRPGNFYVRGVLETPMPRLEIEGVGVISFPVPDSQIKDMVKHAERAPYGRGGETILDTSVRNAWQ